MKIEDSVLLSLFTRDNEKCNIPHATYHRLKRYANINTKCNGVNDTEGPEKYNNTDLYNNTHLFQHAQLLYQLHAYLYFFHTD